MGCPHEAPLYDPGDAPRDPTVTPKLGSHPSRVASGAPFAGRVQRSGFAGFFFRSRKSRTRCCVSAERTHSIDARTSAFVFAS